MVMLPDKYASSNLLNILTASLDAEAKHSMWKFHLMYLMSQPLFISV